jgi:iron-sulfur cluster repair protein YtfE (RIC family)
MDDLQMGCRIRVGGDDGRACGCDEDPDETLNELVARCPAAMPVLRSFGLDLCCGGGLTPRQAAAAHDVPFGALSAALAGFRAGDGR